MMRGGLLEVSVMLILMLVISKRARCATVPGRWAARSLSRPGITLIYSRNLTTGCATTHSRPFGFRNQMLRAPYPWLEEEHVL
jgi:hypothetical protein